jgi:hypothetical protein
MNLSPGTLDQWERENDWSPTLVGEGEVRHRIGALIDAVRQERRERISLEAEITRYEQLLREGA